MSVSRFILVSKRESGVELFDAGKTRRCLNEAMRACGHDPRFADPLARAVELHLRDWPRTRPPTTDYVFRCLRTALTETGMSRVARQLAVHRRQRAERRRHVVVRRRGGAGDRVVPWRKSAVADALELQHGVGHSVARFLASEIERRVLGLGYGEVSTALIVELMRSELTAWGLADGVNADACSAAHATGCGGDGQSEGGR